MRDEYDDRMYQLLRQDMNDAVAALFALIATMFTRSLALLYPPARQQQKRALGKTCETQMTRR